jgi:hypothetical protein
MQGFSQRQKITSLSRAEETVPARISGIRELRPLTSITLGERYGKNGAPPCSPLHTSARYTCSPLSRTVRLGSRRLSSQWHVSFQGRLDSGQGDSRCRKQPEAQPQRTTILVDGLETCASGSYRSRQPYKTWYYLHIHSI